MTAALCDLFRRCAVATLSLACLASVCAHADGTIKVTIAPPQALAAGGQWSINGGVDWNDSDTVLNVADGEHTVTFKPLAGWNTPENVLMTVAGSDETTTGGYRIWYFVDQNNTSGNEDGLAWDTAFTTIQEAVDAAAAAADYREVWVADGTYTGTGAQVVLLPEMTQLVGGFDGIGTYETDISQSDLATYNTVIDGEGVRTGVVNGNNCFLQSCIVTQCNPTGFSASGGNHYIFGCLFINNAPVGSGFNGAAVNVTGGATILLTANTYAGNAVDENGGAVYAANSTVFIVGDTYSANSATGDGGAFCAENSTVNISNSQFSENAAALGGGLYLVSTEATLEGNLVVSNSASVQGGGLKADFMTSPVVMNGNLFAGNTAQDGGAVDAFISSVLDNRNAFTQNSLSAANTGGVVSLVNSTWTGVNSIYVNNCAGTPGADFKLGDAAANAQLTNCTFSGTWPDPHGPFIRKTDASTCVVSNCILWKPGVDFFALIEGNNITVQYSVLRGEWPGTGNINADPLFANPGSGDYHLLEGSPAIDAANDALAPADDFDSSPRPAGTHADIGAYEGFLPTGTVTVAIEPAEVAASGTWSVDGGYSWHDDGDSVSAPEGDVTLTFGPVTNWDAPADATIQVSAGSTTSETGTYVRHSGTLTVNLSPAAAVSDGAAWSVDGGGTWNDSGATVTLPTGTYTITFSSVAGWSAPASEPVTVAKDDVLSRDFTYTSLKGSITIDIEPADAVTAGATWSIQGGASGLADGATVNDLVPGDYIIEFAPVAGWDTPAPLNLTLPANGALSETGTYVQQLGILGVTFAPPEAVGAQWFLDGDDVPRSAGDLSVPAGSHTISFSTLAGWYTPADQVVDVPANGRVDIVGTYTLITGQLAVNISPAGAVTDGAQWSTAPGVWRNSGDTETHPAGAVLTVTYQVVAGWITPPDESVTILEGQTITLTGTYIPEVVYHSSDTNQNGRIDLTEMMRVIQFFNAGGFHCETGTEDGFAPFTGGTSCSAHNSDYNPQNWQIEFSELLRNIQFYNARAYHECAGSEDGFCPGT